MTCQYKYFLLKLKRADTSFDLVGNFSEDFPIGKLFVCRGRFASNVGCLGVTCRMKKKSKSIDIGVLGCHYGVRGKFRQTPAVAGKIYIVNMVEFMASMEIEAILVVE
ncbi:hypothetical protein V9T40_007595 [Parthenolecanium corni]|uniref:Uncharacterized protein n=1 Tax=Parthenolecanium corni TaxID=536013 RepID=A0AAN9THX7_9HEMI